MHFFLVTILTITSFVAAYGQSTCPVNKARMLPLDSMQLLNVLSCESHSEIGTFCYPGKDSNVVIYLKGSSCKIFDRKNHLIEVGEVYQLKRNGRWVDYFLNGSIKTVGTFNAGIPVSQWQFYFPNGQLEEEYCITYVTLKGVQPGYCISGPYGLYFQSGQRRVSGFFNATTGFEVAGRRMGATPPEILPKQVGKWLIYDSKGNIIDAQDFDVIPEK